MTKVMHDSSTPAHGQQVVSAVAFIHREVDGVHQVFMPKRADTKEFLPGVYELVGGHIDFGEDIVDGLKREIMEELGVRASIGDAFAVFTYLNKIKGSHSVEVAFFGRFLDSEEKIVINHEDHSDYSWFSREDVVNGAGSIRPEESVLHGSMDITGSDDDEFKMILKGFDILEGRHLDFG